MRHPDPVRAQYERFPYPPGSALRLPVRGQGASLTWERGVALARTSPLGDLSHGLAPDHRGLRILVAGAGTLSCNGVYRWAGSISGKPFWLHEDGSERAVWYFQTVCARARAGLGE